MLKLSGETVCCFCLAECLLSLYVFSLTKQCLRDIPISPMQRRRSKQTNQMAKFVRNGFNTRRGWGWGVTKSRLNPYKHKNKESLWCVGGMLVEIQYTATITLICGMAVAFSSGFSNLLWSNEYSLRKLSLSHQSVRRLPGEKVSPDRAPHLNHCLPLFVCLQHVHVHVLPRKAGDFERNDSVYDEVRRQTLDWHVMYPQNH